MNKIWNEAKECMSRDEMSVLQGKRLVKMVNYVYHNVEFYRKRMQEAGLEPGDIRGLEDLTKLPYTTKNDLRDTYPFGLFAAPQSEIVRIHASSGTTGKATVVGYTRRDIDIWSECVSRALTMCGIGKNDIVQVAYGYGIYNAVSEFRIRYEMFPRFYIEALSSIEQAVDAVYKFDFDF